MKSFDIISPEHFQTMPWKNGLGNTIEIFKEDTPDNTGFAWRLSMADVTTDGAFSNFAGYDRTLLLLEGKGITLLHANGQCDELTEHLQTARFKGDEETMASLHDGPIKDFNIMARRGYCSASVSSSQKADNLTLDTERPDSLLVYAVNGELAIKLSSGDSTILPRGHLLVLRNTDLKLKCSGSAVIAICITYI